MYVTSLQSVTPLLHAGVFNVNGTPPASEICTPGKLYVFCVQIYDTVRRRHKRHNYSEGFQMFQTSTPNDESEKKHPSCMLATANPPNMLTHVCIRRATKPCYPSPWLWLGDLLSNAREWCGKPALDLTTQRWWCSRNDTPLPVPHVTDGMERLNEKRKMNCASIRMSGSQVWSCELCSGCIPSNLSFSFHMALTDSEEVFVGLGVSVAHGAVAAFNCKAAALAVLDIWRLRVVIFKRILDRNWLFFLEQIREPFSLELVPHRIQRVLQ